MRLVHEVGGEGRDRFGKYWLGFKERCEYGVRGLIQFLT